MTGTVDTPQELGGHVDRTGAEDRLERLERQLAEHRETRARLTRELASARDRNEQLEGALRHGAADPLGAKELEDLRARADRQERDLEDARGRVSYLQGRIAEERARAADEHAAPLPAPVVPQPVARAGRVRRLAPLLLLPLAAAGGAVGALAASAADESDAPPARIVTQPLPPCADAAAVGRVVCSTGAVLTITSGTDPVLLPGVQARVLRAERTGATANVRVRLRNVTDGGQRVGGAGRQVYLSLAGRRLYPQVDEQIVPPQQAANLDLRFALDAAARAALARAGGRADLGVLPFDAGARPDRIGVIRLSL